MAKLKGYIKDQVFQDYKKRYKECMRMLNGLERSLEKHLPEKSRRWTVEEALEGYDISSGLTPSGWPPLP